MIPVEAWRNAAYLSAFVVALAGVAQLRGAWRWLPAFALAGVGLALWVHALARDWALASLQADAPWLAAALLAAWSAHAGSGWLKATAWPAVVVAAALFGDRFVALGLAAAEPDPARRARLVVAASGASLVGVTSGAAPLMLGWGGLECVGIGLVLAAVGFTRGGTPPRVGRPDLRAAGAAAVVPLVGAVAVWLAILGGGLEFLAEGLEQVRYLSVPHGELLVYAGSAFGSVVGDEGLMAMLGRETLLRALSLRGDTVEMAMRAGLAVGGGLPLLVLTRSRLRVGLPLWLAQVAIAAAWIWLRHTAP